MLLIFALLIGVVSACTLDPSTSKIIDESLALLSNITRANNQTILENDMTKLRSLITLIAYNVGYNSTSSITIKQYTETYFPAITLTLLFIILIITITILVLSCKKNKKQGIL